MALVLLLDLVSSLIRPTFLSEPMISVLCGILLGPAIGFGLIDLNQIGEPRKILQYTAHLTLAIGLMGVALRIPPLFPKKFVRTLNVLLLLGMPLMWLSGSLLAFVILDVPLMVALLIGAIVTPTDPIVSTTIVTGRVAEECLPYRLRHSISAEAGFNDGLAYPFVAFGILLLAEKTGGELAWEWVRRAWMIKTLMGAVMGGALGFGAAKLLHVAERHGKMEIKSLLSYAVALSLVSLATAELAGANGILAVFIAGLCFGAKAGARERFHQENVQEAVNRFFTLPIFFLIGLTVPWSQWLEIGAPAFVFALAILVFRRAPAWLLMAPLVSGLRRSEMVFAGWFGPIGIAALYYSLHAETKTGNPILWPITSLVICASILAHGITAAPFSRYLKKKKVRARG